jgi:3'-phosphoadenosine 5'-phosphosulfate synthase
MELVSFKLMRAICVCETVWATGPCGGGSCQLKLLNAVLAVLLSQGGQSISPWHDIPLKAAGADVYNAVIEIPMYTTAKLEVQKALPGNPIKQDTNSDGSTRYYHYGNPPFNYGLLPQTFEDPSVVENGYGGDNDPLDIIEVGSGPLPIGSLVRVKVLGALKLIDSGESDNKILVIREDEAFSIPDLTALERVKPGTIAKLVQWLKNYKTADGKPVNSLVSDIPSPPSEAVRIIDVCYGRWQALKSGEIQGTGFYIG